MHADTIQSLKAQLAELEAAAAAAAQNIPAAPIITPFVVQQPRSLDFERDFWAQFDWTKPTTEIAKLANRSYPTTRAARARYGFGSPAYPRGRAPSLLGVTRAEFENTPVEELSAKYGVTPGAVRAWGRKHTWVAASAAVLKRAQTRAAAAPPVVAAAEPAPGISRALHNCRDAIRRMRGILTAAYQAFDVIDGQLPVCESDLAEWLQSTKSMVD